MKIRLLFYTNFLCFKGTSLMNREKIPKKINRENGVFKKKIKRHIQS